MVEALLVKESLQILGNLILVLPILDMASSYHPNICWYLDVRATMLRSLQRAKEAATVEYVIRSCRGQYMCRKG